MMNPLRRIAVLALGLFLMPAAAHADLGVGDPAPKLDVGQWVQGEPVQSIEKGKIYVVEFWATWCGPCRATIPHLTELSKKYPDIIFIGANVWERDEKLVVPFVKQMGEKMTYRVALDNKTVQKEGAMATTWMQAAGQDGIPAAFIINKDMQVAWIGHPAAMDKPLEQIVKGNFDMKAAAAAAEADAKKQQALAKVGPAVQSQVITPVQQGKYDEALTALEKIIKENPEAEPQLLNVKLAIFVQKGDLNNAYATMDQLTAADDASAGMLNAFAWVVMTEPPFAKQRDTKRAAKWAQMAVDKTEAKEPAVLDTLARAQAMNGDFDKATGTQQKAIELAEGEMKQELSKTLESYRKKVVPEPVKERPRE